MAIKKGSKGGKAKIGERREWKSGTKIKTATGWKDASPIKPLAKHVRLNKIGMVAKKMAKGNVNMRISGVDTSANKALLAGNRKRGEFQTAVADRVRKLAGYDQGSFNKNSRGVPGQLVKKPSMAQGSNSIRIPMSAKNVQKHLEGLDLRAKAGKQFLELRQEGQSNREASILTQNILDGGKMQVRQGINSVTTSRAAREAKMSKDIFAADLKKWNKQWKE